MECPKCGYIRQATDLAPDWQCPSCKVAYVKARKAIKPATEPALTQAQTANTEEQAQADEELQYELQTLAASGQKIVIYSIILNFILRSAERGQAMPDLALTVLFFAVSLWSVWGVLKICTGLGRSQNQKILFMVLSFMPLINLIILIYLSAKTNKMLKEAGWTVGLLGAKP